MKQKLYNIWKYLLTWFGDLYFATEPPKCKAVNIENMMEIINAGDIICRGYTYYADSYFIPNEYTHSGIVINKREIIHSIAEGVQSIHPIDFVKDTDRFIIIRPIYSVINEVRESQIAKVVERAIWHCEYNKTEYDFTFKDDNKFYCHEFTSDCLEKAGIIINKTNKEFGIWPFKFKRDLYLAQNLIDAGKIIYEFNPK